MKKTILKAFKKAAGRFFDYRDVTLAFKDIEDLHQMRVTGRTLNSYQNALIDPKRKKQRSFKRVRRPLKEAMSMLGKIRDTDVLIEEVQARVPHFTPAQQEVITAWLKQKDADREHLRANLTRALPKIVNKKWVRRIDDWADKKIPRLAKPGAIARKVNELRVEKEQALEEAGKYASTLSAAPATADEAAPVLTTVDKMQSRRLRDENLLNLLHQARIRVKKLRYTLEVAKKFMDVDKQEIDSLKVLQDDLGHIQDMRIWINELEAFRGEAETREITAAWRLEMAETLRKVGLNPPEAMPRGPESISA